MFTWGLSASTQWTEGHSNVRCKLQQEFDFFLMNTNHPAKNKVWIIFIVSDLRKDIISDLQPDGKSKRRR